MKVRSQTTPRIVVEAKDLGTGFEFSVKDNGIGMEKRYLDYIFEPFKRLHDRKLSGSGLGLSICRNIVKLYNGTLKVDSTVGEGSTFYFTLPKATNEIDFKEFEASSLQEIS